MPEIRVVDDADIEPVSGLILTAEFLLRSVNAVNLKLVALKDDTEALGANIFSILDFRMLSGLVGEALVTEISETSDDFEKNPNIDGYPDLLNASCLEYRECINKWKASNFGEFIKFRYGGLEIKNTFGTKKHKAEILPGHQRIEYVNPKLDWKAHHRYTNHLLGLYSDFVDDCPQIVAAMYSDSLEEEDWAEKQNPKEGSTMTSFSVIQKSGWVKMKGGLKLCVNDPKYLKFFAGD